MTDRAEFHVMGQPLDGGPFQYTASGLDYVYLLNGFTIEEDPEHGRLLTIDAVDDLHKVIGLHVILQKEKLGGPEFRFLRKVMRMKQAELASELDLDAQTIANYEKGKKIPGTSDKLMRFLFALWLIPEDARAGVLKQIAERHAEEKRTRESVSSGFAIAKWREGRLAAACC